MNLKDFYSKIYIIHYKPLTDRKNYLVSKFEEFGLTDMVEWVDQFETDDEVKKIKNPFNLPKKLLAVNAAHMYCYKNQLKNKYKNILILEDDIVFDTVNFPLFLDQCAFEFEKLDGDIAFLSSCCDLKVEKPKPPTLLYYDPSYVTRCMGAYIVNIRCAEKILTCSSVNFHGIDIVLNKLLPHINVRVLWSALYLKQGSETGAYKSNMLDIRDKDGNYSA